MQNILKMYYGIDVSIQEPGYFSYHDALYYIAYVQDIQHFLEIYRFYRYLMHMIGVSGYRIVKNHNQDIISSSWILLIYQPSSFQFSYYLQSFLQPLSLPKMKIKDIKEQWIQKIDCVRDHVKDYAYSFKHDQDMISFIYYYCGVGETSIQILNEILNIDAHAGISLSLSLLHPIDNYVHEIVNPCHYTLSSRSREIVYLLQSHLITYEDVENILETQYFDVYEIIYLYARCMYPSYFFDQILAKKINQENIQNYYMLLQEEKQMYQRMYQILSFYVRLPKISWINHENMV